MIRSASIVLVVTGFIILTACKKSDDSATVDTTDEGTNRSVKCGTGACKNDDYCCGTDGWADANCSVICENEHTLFCDDATDCPAGNVCCYISTNGNVTSSTCLDTRPFESDRGQLCKAGSTECAGKACNGLALLPAGLTSCQ